MPITTTQGFPLPEGTHEGVITDAAIKPAVSQSGEPLGFDYLHATIKVGDETVVYQVSATLSSASALGRLVASLQGSLPEVGSEWDEHSLVGGKVQFAVVFDGRFHTIKPNSVLSME